MKERRNGMDSERRRPSPRWPPAPPRSRDFNPSRREKYSPYNRQGTEKYSREAERPRRIEKRDHFDRDINLRAPRFSEYDRDRGKDRYAVGARRSRSPQRIGKKDSFDRDVGVRTVVFFDYDGGGKDKDKYGVNVGRSRRSYDEDSYRGDLSLGKFQPNHLLDGSRKSDHVSVKDYSHTRDYYGVGDTNTTGGGTERDYYPYSRYPDSGRAELLVSQYLDSTKPVLEPDRGGRVTSHSYSLTHGGIHDIPLRNLRDADVSSVASRYLPPNADKQGYFHRQDDLHLEKRDGAFHDREDRYFEKNGDFHFQDGLLGIDRQAGRETYKYKKEDDFLSSRGYLKGDSDYMISSSQPKDYVSVASLREAVPGFSATEDLHMQSHGIRRGSGSGLASERIGFDGYGEMKQNMSPRGHGVQLDNTRSSSRFYLGLPEEKCGDQLYAEFGIDKIDHHMSMRPSNAEDKYRDQHMSRIDVVNPIVDESSHRKYMRDDELWNQYSFSRGRSTPDKFDVGRSLHGRKQDLDMLGTGSSRLNYENEGYRGYGSFKTEEHYAEVDGGLWSRGERSDILQSREYDPSFGGHYDSPRKRLPLYEHGVGIRISTDGNGGRKIYNQDERDLVSFSKKPRSGKPNYEKTWRTSSEMDNYQPSSSKFNPSRLVNSRKSDSRDIKKRLGPRKLHVSQRLVKKYKPSIKKRLAPAPQPRKRAAALPWMKNVTSKSVQDDNSDGSRPNQDGERLEDRLRVTKHEPPEKSEDFKQLVQSAFFKFLKQINETPTKRKKYGEQGKAGSLKCIVCGSNSDEFVETESLAMHAFTSNKVGLRSQHLGLHKALCVTMGWKVTEEPTKEWHCEVISNVETSTLKEDLIIWPPVVIIHNSTVDNKNPDERVIVSTEKLDSKLRDMGFGSILKICNGKPANQSAILVKFNGTLTGLREAERFHKNYLESKHGRSELEHQLNCKKASSSGEESYLYGHLGIAEDLDKLDFDTKKRCVLRSKKEILSIVDAPSDEEE
ncbi:hypothetical protein BUALT_Bualt02G0030200 [Buddleja alternifolia]|uniref:XS domain-containing protein n=1 Tax=Buddleja alternifolia TaxID=168488 RepID=A0AAV6Y3R3_9LAMI|nr:hypothetical protein BUALT_Bualt02G0030200 [Buddleja alternifolia]